MDVVLALIAIVVGLLIYFAPSLVASSRTTAGPAFLVNLLLGWTIIGWLVAMVIAVMGEKDPNAAPLIGTGRRD